jgi:phosphoserine phosphatase RsbU/P
MPIVVLMVDDQPFLAQGVKRMLATDPQIQFHYCEHPEEALKIALEIKPTVILQDLVMPGVDGLELVKRFRAEHQTINVPLIVLSSREEPEVKHQAFALGANDYMVKFPDALEVIARIRYHSQAYNLRVERDQTYAALQASQATLRTELDEAKRYVQSLLPLPYEDTFVKTDSVQISSTILGGDAFGHHWIDPDHLAIFLLDVCGHGVGAALLSVSVMNVLRSQTLADVNFCEPNRVLAGLNNAFDMEKQNQMYFTLWYGVYKPSTHTLTYSSGGHPPAVLIPQKPTEKEGSIIRLRTPGLVIGAMPNIEYTQKETPVQSGDRLYVFSDGMYEINDAHTGQMYTLDECVHLFEKPEPNKVASLLKATQKIQGKDNFDDDFSLLEVLFK